jgi:hypothetical protein
MSDLVYSSLLQVVRGSRSPNSVVGPHSLLEDMYGERESVSGCVFLTDPTLTLPDGSTTTISGLSNGQIIEIVGLSFGADRQPGIAGQEDTWHNPTVPAPNALPTRPTANTNIIDDVGELGPRTTWTTAAPSPSDDSRLSQHLSPAQDPAYNRNAPTYTNNSVFPCEVEGYFAGCVLTMLTGNAAGQSTHIVRWYNAAPTGPTNHDWRLWIRPFPNGAKPAAWDRFVINGKPFNGAGFGYDTLEMSTLSASGGIVNSNFQVGWKRPLPSTISAPIDIASSMSWPMALTPNPIDPYYRGFLKDRPTSTLDTLLNIDGVDADEDWDISDNQNMALAGMMVNPTTGQWEVRFPSFHRPDLVNYWYGLHTAGALPTSSSDWVNRMRPDLRRRIMLRPQPDYNFDDLNSNGVWDSSSGEPDFTGNVLGNLGAFDPINGPWDVDNDGDGRPDSVWLDLGFPVQTSADGQLVKPLVAVLCLDLDGRLNVNAHGNPTHYRNGLPTVASFTASVSAPNTSTIAANATQATDESYLIGGGAFSSTSSVTIATNTSTTSAARAEPLFSVSTSYGTPIACSYSGGPFAGLTPQINAASHTITAGFSAANVATGNAVLNPLGTGLGFGVADINLGAVLDAPYVHDDRSYGTKSYHAFRVNPYRFLLEGNWDGIPRSTTAYNNSQPNNISRMPISGRYGEPHILDMTGTYKQAPGFLHPPRAGITSSLYVNRTNVVVLGDDNLPAMPAGILAPATEQSLSSALFARGDRVLQTSGLAGAANYNSTSSTFGPAMTGLYGSPYDPNGRLIVGLDLRGMPLFANDAPAYAGTIANNAWAPTTASYIFNPAIDDPYELDLSGKANRATNLVVPSVITMNSTNKMGPVDAPITPVELESLLRPRDNDTVNNYDRIAYLLTGTSKQGFSDLSRRVTSEQWDLPCPNLQPTPEIRDALASPRTAPTGMIPGLGIPATNLSFADFLRGKIAAVIRAQTGTLSAPQIAALTTASFTGAVSTGGTPSFNFAALITPTLFPTNTLSQAVVFKNGAATLTGSTTPPMCPRLVSPELLMNLRMNLNRPLGNGVDETPSPDPTTTTLSYPGQGVVDEPLEAFNATGNSTLSVIVGYTNTTSGTTTVSLSSYSGQQQWKGSKFGATNFDANWDGRILNERPRITDGMCEIYGRQELAKHLYVLAMMMMDSKFTFPTVQMGLTPQQQQILTSYRIAQWAINAVDFADRDAIMTPFEFDIYPFSYGDPYNGAIGWQPGGWDVDGNPATNDNSSGARFRGVVWGMEYPELLLTETLAVHDKGVADTDEDAPGRTSTSVPTRGQRFTAMHSGGQDSDFDQIRLPQGSAFIELYCTGRSGSVPTTPGGAPTVNDPALNYLPRELYDTSTSFNGTIGTLDLSRTAPAPTDPPPPATPLAPARKKGTPVWRILVTTPHLGYRADVRVSGASQRPTIREQLFDASTNNPSYAPDTTTLQPEDMSLVDPGNQRLSIEREVWFASTTDSRGNQILFSRSPDLTTGGWNGNNLAANYQPILAAGGGTPPRFLLTPGGYSVVGPARPPINGQYKNITFVGFTDGLGTNSFSQSYTTVRANWIPQIFDMTGALSQWIIPLQSTPGALAAPSTDPSFFYPTSGIGAGGYDIRAPLLVPVAYTPTTASADSRPYLGFNVSEPAGGYTLPANTTLNQGAPNKNGLYTFTVSGGVAGAVPNNPFDEPAGSGTSPLSRDGLVHPGTVLDYRTVILQRLADPTAPWNPADSTDTNYVAQLPVNEYRTVDWMPIDLTIFNGQVSYIAPTSASGTLTPIQSAQTLSSGWKPPTSWAATMAHNSAIPPTGGQASATWSGWTPTSLTPTMANNTPNYIRYYETSTAADYGQVAMCFESRQRGPRVAISEATSTVGATQIMVNALANPTNATNPQGYAALTSAVSGSTLTAASFAASVAGSWSPGTVTNNGAFCSFNDAVPEAPLWAAISDNPRLRFPSITTITATTTPFRHEIKGHSLGFVNNGYGRERVVGGTPRHILHGAWANITTTNTNTILSQAYGASGNVDPTSIYNYAGAPQRPFPWLTWNNRPYANAMELLLVPSSSPGRFTTEFTYTLPTQWTDRYTGSTSTGIANYFGGALEKGLNNHYAASAGMNWGTWASTPTMLPLIGTNTITPASSILPHLSFPPVSPSRAGTAMPSVNTGITSIHPFGHLLNLFASSNAGSDYRTAPSSNLYRLLEFVHVPSRFSGTEDLLVGTNGVVNGSSFETTVTNTLSPSTAMAPFIAPFNRVSRYREPGKININTLVDHLGKYTPPGGATVIGSFSDMWRGITNGFPEPNQNQWYNIIATSANVLLPDDVQIGQYFRDLVSARSWWYRGTGTPAQVNPIPGTSNQPNNPPRTVRDFAAFLQAAPLTSGQPNPVAFGNSSAFNNLSPTFFRPFRSFAAPVSLPTIALSNGQLLADNNLFRRLNPGLSGANPAFNHEPLFAVNHGDLWSSTNPVPIWGTMFNDPNRDPFFRYQLLTKLGGMFTTRSNVYAIWVTVGLFEVERMSTTQLRALQTDLGHPNRDGYRIARELGSSLGSTRRFRGFALVDRTIPVGFQRGENYNVDKCFLVRRLVK